MNHVRFHGAMKPRRAMRQADSPYRRRRMTWGAWLDRLCWVIVVVATFAGTAFVLGYTIHRLNGLWGPL